MRSVHPAFAFFRTLIPDLRPVGIGVGVGIALACGVFWLARGATVGATAAPDARLSPEAQVASLEAQAEGWGSSEEREHALWLAILTDAAVANRPHHALLLAETFLERFPHSARMPAVLAQRAALLERVDAPDAAIAWQEAAMAANPNGEAGRYWLRAADRFVATGDGAAAEAAYRAATRSEAHAATAWMALGRLSLASDPAEAHTAYSEAVRTARRPETEKLARLGAATALERLEGREAALAEVDDALAEAGPDPALERRRQRLQGNGRGG